MNPFSMVKGILLVLVFFGLMASILPSRTPLVRLGEGGPLSWFLIGHGSEGAGADHVVAAC